MSLHNALRALLFHFGAELEEPVQQNTDYIDYTEEENTKNLIGHPLHDQLIADTGSSPTSIEGPAFENVPIRALLDARQWNTRLRNPYQNPIMNYTDMNRFGPRVRTHITQRFMPDKHSLLASYPAPIFCGMFSSDGSMFMSACKDERIRLHDTNNWKVVNTIRARNIGWSIISTDYSPDLQWLIYSTWSPYVHMANTRGPHQTHNALDFKPRLDQRFCLFSVQFSPDSREIVGGSSDEHLYIYDLDRNERIEKVKAHIDDINAVAYADQSNQIIFSGSDDGLIKIWDRRQFTSCVGILPGHSQGITFIDSKMDGWYLISNSKDQSIKLWDRRKMTSGDSVKGRQNDFHYNSYYGARGYEQIRRRPKHHKDDQSLMTYTGHAVLDTLIRCRFSPKESTGQKYIYTGSHDGVVYVYDVLTGKCVKKLQGAHTATVRDVHWHPTKPLIITTSWDGKAFKWECDEHAIEEEKEVTPTTQFSRLYTAEDDDDEILEYEGPEDVVDE